jgi:hypothetical protein
MSQHSQAVCPKCRTTLIVPLAWHGQAIRCKACGVTLRTTNSGGPVLAPKSQAPGSLDADARATASPPPQDSNQEDSPLARYLARRRRKFYIRLAVAGVLLLTSVGVAYALREHLVHQLGQFVAALRSASQQSKSATAPSQAAPTTTSRGQSDIAAKTAGQGGTASGTVASTADVPAKPQTSTTEAPSKAPPSGQDDRPQADVPAAAPPVSSAAATRPVSPASAEFSKQYPGRALLVGIRNYLYANPLNPGYRPENSLTRDPLGLHQLKKVLIEGLRFDKSQVLELSDVAEEKPVSPTKPTLQATIRVFLEEARPQDRVLLVLVCHAVELEEQGYLAPIEADFGRKEDLIPLTWLYEQLENCKAHRRLLILDIAHLDPEQGLARSGGEKLTPKMEEQLKKVPDGLEVWLSCSAGEHSYEFASSGFIGSVFLHFLQDFARDLTDPKKRREIEKDPEFLAQTMPLLYFAPKVNKEVTTYVQERWKSPQTPKVLGVGRKAPEVSPDAPLPPPVRVVEPLGSEPLADASVVEEIVRELGLVESGPQSLPPFAAKSLEPYLTPADRDLDPEKHPLRQVTLDTITKLLEIDKQFNAERSIKAEANDAQFKQAIERKQQLPARLNQSLEEIMEAMERAAAQRDKDTKRWQAHFDYVFAQLLARRIAIMEYNFVLGNKLRKDSPMITNPQNNGWLIVPSERLQQKDTRNWEKQRQEILDRIIKEHPGTPWEVLARRDKNTFLGLTLQEGKVD